MEKAENNQQSRLNVYITFARPFTLLAPLIGFICGGIGALGVNIDIPLSPAVFLPLFLGTLMAASLNAASNGINQIYDLKIDAVNKPTRPLPSGTMSIKEAWVFSLFFYGLSLALAWFANPPGGKHECFYIVLVAAFLTYAYSGPPFRTKRFGMWANLTITIPRGLLLPVSGWAAVATVINPEPWYIGSIFAIFILGAASTKDFSDMEGDLKEGCITPPIKYGVRKCAYIISPFLVIPFLLFPAGVYFGILNGHPLFLTVLGFALALYGLYVAWLIVRKPEELATEANHVSWKHMYLLMMAAQAGFAAAYLIKRVMS